ncbi:MAG: HAMP domain-containing histidine kinase [Desulfobacterales bacterium]|nr:MAG: HAMP domain-containing histidine kinase [Desulfobacterales bacterium]
MDRTKWFFHPIMIFIFSIVALALSLSLYIYWYIEVSTGLKEIIHKFNLDSDQILKFETWVVILVLSVLVGVILVGIFIIFIYNIKIIRLYRLQNNFINNFTHELKTPVTSLSLYLETFMKHELSRNDQTKYLGYMIEDIDRLSDNINRILNIAKIESKSYVGEYVTEDLVSAVEKFLINHHQLFQHCEITIHNPHGSSFPYLINPSLFEMLLMNLLTNAVKYNEADMPKIDITFKLINRRLHLRFKDNGVGIEKGEVKKIFRKFYQTGHSDDMSAIGSGLGLHLVQNIARIHKGKVLAESKGRGKGSVFTLILPYKGTNEST